jgi:hypothetical protein
MLSPRKLPGPGNTIGVSVHIESSVRYSQSWLLYRSELKIGG